MSNSPGPIRLSAAWLAVLLVLALWVWLSDFVTLQGERTIYTVRCEGTWSGRACRGKLLAGPRYRFRALRPHGEVLFWTVGSPQPSGRFTACAIADGRNWRCPPGPAARETITLQMEHGRALHDASGQARDFHAVTKLHWLLLRWGWPGPRDADY
jgi:CxxC motif-containing protein (DUF1111 family)